LSEQHEATTVQTFTEETAARVLDGARLKPADAVLDTTITVALVCGALARLGPDGAVIALDPSVDRLEGLRRACPDSRAWYLVGTPDVLPLPDESVDVALAESLSSHARDPADAAADVYRVLRPAGRVSVFEGPECDTGALERGLSRAGFVDVRVERHPNAIYLTAAKP
jgi:ubiquinone/menaquinone biosynthesis C-methylase UbiE